MKAGEFQRTMCLLWFSLGHVIMPPAHSNKMATFSTREESCLSQVFRLSQTIVIKALSRRYAGRKLHSILIFPQTVVSKPTS